ncbi:MAG: hypothetical protein M3R63_00895 [Actinomycetota bacterium]|nr:hypothetical protein [Actinomycetota bacterium]
MIGDDPAEDGGIGWIAGRYVPVDRAAPEQRPDGLLASLTAAGIGREDRLSTRSETAVAGPPPMRDIHVPFIR